MLKLAGGVFVLTAGFLARRAVVSKLQASLDVCHAMGAALLWMEVQVRMELAPVPRLLPRLSQRAIVGDFFAVVAQEIERGRSLYEAWTDALAVLPLCGDECETLRALGERLDGEEESVCRALAAAARELEKNFANRKVEFCERKRLYSALCFGGSALFVIVLI